ncbi:MAG: HAL/PAL/TAL family ammonia-lyase [Ktedonobacterales bacterium]
MSTTSTTHTAAVTLALEGITIEDVFRVAVDGAPLVVATEVDERIQASRAVVEHVLARNELVYGLTSQVGHGRDQRVDPEALVHFQELLVQTHAGGIGAPLPEEQVRAIMLARLAGLARGGAGIHPGAFHTLVQMLNAGVNPVIPEGGSVGASDISHHAAMALVMIGRGQAHYRGEILPGGEALARAGIAPYQLQPKDGLALISANGFAVGVGALTLLEAERVAALADLVGALSLEAAGANLSPFEAEVVAAKPFAGQAAVAQHMRALLAGSYLNATDRAASVQDPLSFRVIPQVHGALREQLTFARRSVEVELNASDDNPLVSIVQDRLISNGNFHPMVLALAFDALRVGLAHAGMLAERRTNKVFWPHVKRLQPLMGAQAGVGARPAGDVTGSASSARDHEPLLGLPVYGAASVLAALKHLAAPATLECPPLDLDVEDHATLAPLAVTLTRDALRHLETILAIEALIAVQSLGAQEPFPQLGAGTGAAYANVRAALLHASARSSASAAVETVRAALHSQV